MWVHLFSDSLMGVKAEPPNQLLPEPRLALPWRRVFATPRPAAQGWGAQPARGGPGWPAEAARACLHAGFPVHGRSG